jgi:hypothetical protein
MQLALGLMCQPTQNGAFQPYQCMAMVFRYRQSEDNDACQGRDVDFTGRSNFPPNPLPTPGLCGGPAGECLGWCISPARFASMRSTKPVTPFRKCLRLRSISNETAAASAHRQRSDTQGPSFVAIAQGTNEGNV